MTACPACGADGPQGARFCPACGSELAARPGMATERKVVTVLFCDLVGFTALCEKADPEDIDRLLRDYYTFARDLIERYGGSVEKFIGDAVVGAFGVPSAHEDDAERAVRAGWRLIGGVGEILGPSQAPLAVRVGINTGPALVRLDAGPRSGEGLLVGDAINTAQRLQTMAPPSGLVVGGRTRSLAAAVATYEALPPSALKGKSQTVAPWRVTGLTARTGIDLAQRFSAPLVGREIELGVLKGLFDKAVASSTPQFALLSGEAGIGKTRLIFELARDLDARPNLLVTWRQARCLPYGEGVSLAPLAEIVREHAGIAEVDDPDTVAAKLDRAVGTGPDNWWVTERLRPLLGLPSRPASQDENFAAWAQFLDGIATDHPAVVVVDDLHWADEGLLAFMVFLAERRSTVPMLFIAAARPEFLESHEDLGQRLLAGRAQGRGAVRIDMRSLAPVETGRLIDGLTVASMPPEVTSAIVERGGGNPFYTEELVRLLEVDRQADPARPTNFASLPDSLQALVTARLDSLQPDRKAVLADAAVVGQVFWPSLVAELGGRPPEDVADILRELVSREFVRPLPEAGPRGEPQFAFWHAVTREAAYAQLPRPARAAKHAAAGSWMEARIAVGADNLVEAVAHHCVTAVELREAAGDSAGDLRVSASAALARAGDSASRLNARAAAAHYTRARDLAAPDSPTRARLQVKLAKSLYDADCLDEAQVLLEDAVNERRAAGDTLGCALAKSHLSGVLLQKADPRALDVAAEAVDMLAPDEVSVEAVTILERLAMRRVQTGDRASVMDLAERAVNMCGVLGIPIPHMTLSLRGYARHSLGERREGLVDLLAGVEAAKQHGSSGDIAALLDAAALIVSLDEGVEASIRMRREGIEAAVTRRDEHAAIYIRTGLLDDLVVVGDWDEALAQAADVLRHTEASGLVAHQAQVEALRALVHLLRGDSEAAAPLVSWRAERRESMIGLGLLCTLVVAVRLARTGDVAGAGTELSELMARPTAFFSEPTAMRWWPEAVRTARDLGRADLSAALTTYAGSWAGLPRGTAAALAALEQEQQGDFAAAVASHEAAAQAWPATEFPYEHAHACLGRGRCLLALGNTAEARATMSTARTVFARLGAKPALAALIGLEEAGSRATSRVREARPRA